MTWLPIESMPDGTHAMTKIDDGKGSRNEQKLRKRGNLFFIVGADGEDQMYVYYAPTHWEAS